MSDMIPERRRNHIQAAAVEAAIRYAYICDLNRAQQILKRNGVPATVAYRVVHPLGARRSRDSS